MSEDTQESASPPKGEEGQNPFEENEDPFSDLPVEGEDEKLTDDKKEESKDDKEEKKRSDVAQKIKYRTKFREKESRVKALEKELADAKKTRVPASEDSEREQKAQDYITDIVKNVVKTERAAEKAEEETEIEEFDEKLETVLEDSDFTEKEVLDICEEYEVEPKVAIKILKKLDKDTGKKPKTPKPKRASSSVAKTEKGSKDETDKDMYQIGQEIKADHEKGLI